MAFDLSASWDYRRRLYATAIMHGNSVVSSIKNAFHVEMLTQEKTDAKKTNPL